MGDHYVGDCGALNGPFDFEVIEWLLIHSKYGYKPYDDAPLKYEYQDLKEIKKKIDSVGSYEYDVTEDGIRIYGYKPYHPAARDGERRPHLR